MRSTNPRDDDITEQRQALGEPQDNERRFRSLTSLAPVGIFETDADGNCLFVNDKWCQLAGIAPAAARGRGWIEALHPEDRERVIREWYAAAGDGGVFASEYRFRTPAGDTYWLYGNAVALHDDAGHVTGYLGTITDITDHKRSEAALRDSEERFRATVDQAAVGVAHVDLDNQTLWANPGLCAMLGYTAAEMRARTFLDVTHPDDREADLALSRRLLAGEIPSYRIEKRYLHKHGSVVWGDLSVSLVRDAGGTPRYGVGVVVDITARKQVEARLEAVFASIDDHLVSYDRQWRYTFVNDGAARVLGKTKEELLGKCIWDLFPDAVGNQYYEELHRATAEQRVIRSEHYYSPFQKWFENHIYPSPDGVTVFSADVTVRKRLEQELHRQNERLAEADRVKDEFLAVLAHELRNPLAPVRSALEVMKMPDANAPMLEHMHDIAERQVRHMARLLDDLLDVSRISQGRIELRLESVDVAEVISRTAEAVRPLFDEQRHEFTVTPPAGPMRVAADPTRLEQILSNLLNNAAKYTPSGGHIWLTAEHADDEVVLRVRDTGLGISSDMLPKVFDLFVHSDPCPNGSQGGVGIGLTLVKRLVELHGGTVHASSAGPGQGSEFIVRLPAAPAHSAVPDQRRNERPGPPLAQQRVLVADDNRDAADSLALLLQLVGQEVRTAYDGPSAVAAANEFRPALVLLDIGMPGLDGYEVARRLRGDPTLAGMRIVALTGWGQTADRRRSADAGFDQHLTKPVDFDALQRLLARTGSSRHDTRV
jgi:PAS domain S-box-containing protein